MKKIVFLVLPLILLSSCGKKMTYESLIVKMKSYTDGLSMNSKYTDGSFTEEYFFVYDGNVTLALESTDANSKTSLFLTLSNSISAPPTYYCLFGWEHFSTSYEEAASFYISNSYTNQTRVYFDNYSGSAALKSTSQDLARTSVNLLLICFDGWLNKELNTSFTDIGLFPYFY